MKTFKHIITKADADKILDWIKTRGGVSVWRSADLSNPSQTWTSPALTDGEPTKKCHWQMENNPHLTIADPAEIGVAFDREVNRFRVATRLSGNGLSVKLTDHSSAKVNKAKEKAGPNSWHTFDYGTQECIIMAPDKIVPLTEI